MMQPRPADPGTMAATDPRVIAAGAPSDPEESLLIARLKRGEDEAFALLVRRHAGRLHAVARRILQDDEEARDAVQEGLLAAFKAIASYRGEALLSTWLHRIVVNAALMRLRAARRQPEEELGDLLPAFDETGHQAKPGGPWRAAPEEEHLREELRARVRRAVDALPAGHRSVLLLRDIEELSTQETAGLLGITENAVKVRLHRARQALKALLEPILAVRPVEEVTQGEGSSESARS